ISDHEVLIDVTLLNIDMTCFVQFMESAYGDKDEMAKNILRIVNERGKLHNSVTGTGGTLFGRVERIGAAYGNRYGIAPGDELCSLSSLTGIPLSIDEISDIDTTMAQVAVRGKAVLFENSPVLKKLDGLTDKAQLAAVEVAGESAETYRLVGRGDRVVILGAAGKMGIFCALAAKRKLAGTGRLIGCVDNSAAPPGAAVEDLCDEIYAFEANDIEALREHLSPMGDYDVVVNCSERPLTEPGCAMLAKPGGVIFFAGWGGNSKTAGLAAETLGKDVAMYYYRGYVDGLTDFFRRLVAEEDVEALLSCGLANDFRYPWMQILDTRKRLITISDGILEDSKDYVFESPKSQELLSTLLKVARFDCNVLITGETGVGKEIAAEIIHRKSNRGDGNFVKINCASIPEHLLESELFGYEGGAFTGSNPKGKAGLWEIANGGVLFLDEIGEMSLLLQSKLLRAIEENEIYRVGGETPIRLDARVIAATNRDLYEMVKEKRFREDLYYRLNVFCLRVPPLRERREDIVPLIDLMTLRYSKKFGINKRIDKEAKELMEGFAWEGNARELENFIQKLFISSLGNEITLYDVTKQMTVSRESILPEREPSAPRDGKRPMPADEERELYRRYKDEYKSTRKMAEALGTSQSSVVRRLRKYGL
ncbi:MAG: sigma 54-interacting transcriptional regulator, partial [Clostridiales Family XIII bacterium]|nr:sigma 54-interacting transcriptional regulator [Clostridiales Family XIII bacterium]